MLSAVSVNPFREVPFFFLPFKNISLLGLIKHEEKSTMAFKERLIR